MSCIVFLFQQSQCTNDVICYTCYICITLCEYILLRTITTIKCHIDYVRIILTPKKFFNSYDCLKSKQQSTRVHP